jgi:hypothetical protein
VEEEGPEDKDEEGEEKEEEDEEERWRRCKSNKRACFSSWSG